MFNSSRLPSGGSKKPEKKDEKTAFLAEVKKRREASRTQKNEQKGVIKIQAFYRGVKERERFLQKFEVDVIKKLNDIGALQKMMNPEKFELILMKAFKSFPAFLNSFVFYSKQTAKPHLSVIEPVARFLLMLLTSTDHALMFLSGGDETKEKIALMKLKKIFSLVMYLNFVDGMIKKKEFAHLCSEWVRVLLPPKQTENEMLSEEEARLRKKKVQIFESVLDSLSTDILEKMANNPITFEDENYRTVFLQTMTKNPKIFNRSVFDQITDLYAVPKALELLSEDSRISFLMTYLELGKLSPQRSPEKYGIAHERLINFLRTMRDLKNIFRKLSETATNNVFAVLSQLIQEYEKSVVYHFENPGEFGMLEEVKEDNAVPSQFIEKLPASLSTGDRKKLQKKYQLELEANVMESFCEFLITPILHLTDSDFNNSVSSACNCILSIGFWLTKANRKLMYSSLAFKYNFHMLLFGCLEETGFIKDCFIIGSEKWLPILAAFCNVYRKKLMITDDEEFVGNTEIVDEKVQTSNIELKKMVVFSKFLNDFVFTIVWERLTKLYHLMHSIVKLLKELYNRDCRIKFTNDPSFWHVQTLDQQFNPQTIKPMKDDILAMILKMIPHMISFHNRLRLFQLSLHQDKASQNRSPGPQQYISEDSEPRTVWIRRSYILEDGYEYLAKRKNMKDLFKITFINDLGFEEEGIDGGGLLKEFMSELAKVAFDINYGLFEEKEDKTLAPNPNSHLVVDHLKLFNFLGRMVGKSIYENHLIESMFSTIFLNRVLGIKNTINELKLVDSQLYKGLLQLKHKEGIAESLGLTFSVNENVLGMPVTHELKENGANIEVNESNKLEYIDLLCSFRLNSQIAAQAKAFAEGLQVCINPQWLKMFNHEELQLLICGAMKKGFNVQDLQNNTRYMNYNPFDLTITHFWQVLNEMSDEDKSLFLLFVTGCSRPPTLGFQCLEPKFSIARSAYGGAYIEHLPTSATCTNLLKLPDYQNKEKLKTKLLYAIRSKSGFNLS